MNKASVTYSPGDKTFTVCSPDVSRAMIFQGNPYNHNRGKDFKSAAIARETMARFGYREIR